MAERSPLERQGLDLGPCTSHRQDCGVIQVEPDRVEQMHADELDEREKRTEDIAGDGAYLIQGIWSRAAHGKRRAPHIEVPEGTRR